MILSLALSSKKATDGYTGSRLGTYMCGNIAIDIYLAGSEELEESNLFVLLIIFLLRVRVYS